MKEIVTLGSAETDTYNPDIMNMNYNATADGLNTTAATTTGAATEIRTLASGQQYSVDANGNFVALVGGVPAGQQTSTANTSSTSTADAMKEYADSMKKAGILSLGGKQMPDEPDNQGNTPILTYTGTGSDGEASYEVFGGLDPNEDASMSYNEDGTPFVPYDGQDPATINTDEFETDFPMNGAAILNELGKDHLLKTGDDSKMITIAEGGGYTFINSDEKITSDDAINIINDAIDDGLLDPEILDPLAPVDEDPPIVLPPIVLPPIDESQPYSTSLYGSRDIMGDFYGGRSGGMWDRFANSYLTRFGYSPEQFDEMVRKVENPDGSVNFFGADGQLINPESLGSNYRLTGDPTTLKIGEEQTTVGQQNYDAQGNLIDTTYYEGYGAQDVT